MVGRTTLYRDRCRGEKRVPESTNTFEFAGRRQVVAGLNPPLLARVAQLDRFLMRIQMGYPDPASEREILRSNRPALANPVEPVAEADDVIELQAQVEQVRVDDAVVDYLMAIVEKTRDHERLALGVSPRGSIALYRAAQALALMEGLDYCTPHHVKRLAVPVFAHRSAPDTRFGSGHAGERSTQALEEILETVPVPL